MYAKSAGREIRLVAVRHDGSDRTMLARSVVAPIASRGDLVAWAEQTRGLQRVVVRNMRSGHVWVAARMRPCSHGRCYRIDAVTLAEHGVVFDRGSIGSQPSLLVRRAFGGARAASVPIANDPQPDLAPSSAGALYCARPWVAALGLRAAATGRRETARARVVDPRLRARPAAARLDQRAMPAEDRAPARRRQADPAARPHVDACLTARVRPAVPPVRRFRVGERRMLIGWSVLPDLSLRTHTDVGIDGVIDSMTVP